MCQGKAIHFCYNTQRCCTAVKATCLKDAGCVMAEFHSPQVRTSDMHPTIPYADGPTTSLCATSLLRSFAVLASLVVCVNPTCIMHR